MQSYHEVLRDVARRALTQEELANRAGIGVATVVRFEKTGRVSLENVVRMATALGAMAVSRRPR